MNPVELELVKLKRRWQQELVKAKSFPMIICTGEKHETDLFDGFMKSRMAEENEDDDIYLVHYQNFEEIQSFGESLWDEWKEMYVMLKESEAPELPDWEIEADTSCSSDAHKAFFPLIALQENFPELKEANFFLYIAPLRISDLSALAGWIDDWCKLCKKSRIENIKLVWAEHHTFKTLPGNSLAHSFRLEVDIHQLMQNTAAHTNRNKNSPDTDFQQQILIASNHLSKSRFEDAKFSLKKATKLAEELNNKEGAITARFMLAQAYTAQRKRHKAEEAYKVIFEKVEKGSSLEIQMYMNYGSFLLGESKKSRAEEAFLKAADLACSKADYAIALECYRTVGVLYDTILTRSKMVAFYEEGIKLGSLMRPEIRAQSSLRYIASVLVNIYGGEQRQQLEQEMQSYFGDEWRIATERPETLVVK